MSASIATIYTHLDQYAPARELVEAAAVLLEKAEKYQVIPSEADVEVVSEFRARLNDTIGKLDEARLSATADARALVATINDEAKAKLDPMRGVLARTDTLLKSYREQQEQKRLAAIREQEAEAKRLAAEKAAAERLAEEARKAAEAAAQTGSDREYAEAIQKAAEAQQAVAAVEQRQEVVSQAVVPAPAAKSIRGSHGSSTGFRDHWKWRLINTAEQPASVSVKLVPEQYLLAPEDRIDGKVLNAIASSQKGKANVPGIEFYNDQIPASRVAR